MSFSVTGISAHLPTSPSLSSKSEPASKKTEAYSAQGILTAVAAAIALTGSGLLATFQLGWFSTPEDKSTPSTALTKPSEKDLSFSQTAQLGITAADTTGVSASSSLSHTPHSVLRRFENTPIFLETAAEAKDIYSDKIDELCERYGFTAVKKAFLALYKQEAKNRGVIANKIRLQFSARHTTPVAEINKIIDKLEAEAKLVPTKKGKKHHHTTHAPKQEVLAPKIDEFEDGSEVGAEEEEEGFDEVDEITSKKDSSSTGEVDDQADSSGTGPTAAVYLADPETVQNEWDRLYGKGFYLDDSSGQGQNCLIYSLLKALGGSNSAAEDIGEAIRKNEKIKSGEQLSEELIPNILAAIQEATGIDTTDVQVNVHTLQAIDGASGVEVTLLKPNEYKHEDFTDSSTSKTVNLVLASGVDQGKQVGHFYLARPNSGMDAKGDTSVSQLDRKYEAKAEDKHAPHKMSHSGVRVITIDDTVTPVTAAPRTYSHAKEWAKDVMLLARTRSILPQHDLADSALKELSEISARYPHIHSLHVLQISKNQFSVGIELERGQVSKQPAGIDKVCMARAFHGFFLGSFEIHLDKQMVETVLPASLGSLSVEQITHYIKRLSIESRRDSLNELMRSAGKELNLKSDEIPQLEETTIASRNKDMDPFLVKERSITTDMATRTRTFVNKPLSDLSVTDKISLFGGKQTNVGIPVYYFALPKTSDSILDLVDSDTHFSEYFKTHHDVITRMFGRALAPNVKAFLQIVLLQLRQPINASDKSQFGLQIKVSPEDIMASILSTKEIKTAMDAVLGLLTIENPVHVFGFRAPTNKMNAYHEIPTIKDRTVKSKKQLETEYSQHIQKIAKQHSYLKKWVADKPALFSYGPGAKLEYQSRLLAIWLHGLDILAIRDTAETEVRLGHVPGSAHMHHYDAAPHTMMSPESRAPIFYSTDGKTAIPRIVVEFRTSKSLNQ